MDKAKNLINKVTSLHGHHDTTVEQTTAPSVTENTQVQTQDKEINTVVDTEKHQDHYHTTVQPVKDQEVLATTHHHEIAPTKHEKVSHHNDAEVQQRLQQESSQFQNKHQVVQGENTTSAAPVIAGEHVHHHVHEQIQPVIQKTTIEPHQVHTTVPVHREIHEAAKHYEATTLPTKTLAEFQASGGSVTGGHTTSTAFDGKPRYDAGSLGSSTTGHNTTGHNTTGHNTTGHNTTGHNITDHSTTGHNSTI